MSGEDPPPQALGDAQLDAADGSLNVPSDVIEWGVLSPGGDAVWAYDPSTGFVVVTRSQPGLEEYPDLTRIDETRVTEDGRLELPEAFTAEGDEYPWSGQFEDGERCHFDADGEMLSKQLTCVLDEDDHEDFWNA